MRSTTLSSLAYILLLHKCFISANDFQDEPMCPDAEAIAPACKCHKSSTTKTLEMDCTGTDSEFLLKHAFEADFPTKNMNVLVLLAGSFKTLESGVFRDITFKVIDIRYGDIETVEEGALDGMKDTAETILLSSNAISQFPFESMKKYTKLKTLWLDDNKLSSMPTIENPILEQLTLIQNPLKKVNPDAFRGLPSLTFLGLKDTELDDFPPGVFSDLPNLTRLDLRGNYLTHLPQDMFKGTNQLNMLALGGNMIERIEQRAIPEILHLEVYISDNMLTVLQESVWRNPFREGVTLRNLENNPLACSCDVAWLVREKPLLMMITDARCDSGSLIKDLNADDFIHCP